MIVVLAEAAGLGLRRVRWRDRVVARVRTSALDRRLAAGASPESSVLLAAACGPPVRADRAAGARAQPDADCGGGGRPDGAPPRGTGPPSCGAALPGRAGGRRRSPRRVGARRRAGGGPGPDPGGRRYGTALPVRATRPAPPRADRGAGGSRFVRLNVPRDTAPRPRRQRPRRIRSSWAMVSGAWTGA